MLVKTEPLFRKDGPDRALDNLFILRLWLSVKYEDVY